MILITTLLISFICISSAYVLDVPVMKKLSMQSHAAKFDQVHEMEDWNRKSQEIFLESYFQKQPVLIRHAFPGIESKLGLHKSDYVDLCTDDDVEVRLFEHKINKITKQYGPFTKPVIESLFSTTGWSLLFQELDRHIPAVADLWSEGFRFMPNWRRDDIMLSLSSPGGTIGGHVDNYDVFLLQGSGARKWSIEKQFVTEKEERRREVRGSYTKLLRDFNAEACWVLQPGDMLYLPPRIPHQGITVGEDLGTTISIGLRAPNYRDLSSSLLQHAHCTLSEAEAFYRDGDCSKRDQLASSAGEIHQQALIAMAASLTSTLLGPVRDEQKFSTWLGEQLTAPLRYQLRPPSAFFLAKQSALTKDTSKNTTTTSGRSIDDGIQYTDENTDTLSRSTLPFSIRSRFRVALQQTFPSTAELLQAVASGRCALRRAEGVRIAHIGETLFVNGKSYRLPGKHSTELAEVLTGDQQLPVEKLCVLLTKMKNTQTLFRFLAKLLKKGYFYPVPVPSSQLHG